MFGSHDIDSFRTRQIGMAVSRERAAAVADLVCRLDELRNDIDVVAIADHDWVRAAWRDKSLADDAAVLVNRIASGPVADVRWDELTPIDRPTFTDRWLRTVACGMAYGPRPGGLRRERIDPAHVAIHDAVLNLF